MKAHLVGSGLASMAAAAYLIKDAGLDGGQITIYEEQDHLGGALHVTCSAETGYSFPGSRIFEWQYRCAMDLFAMVPSVSDPSKSIKAEFNERAGWYNKSRLVDQGARTRTFDASGSGHSPESAADKTASYSGALARRKTAQGLRFSRLFLKQIFGTFGAP